MLEKTEFEKNDFMWRLCTAVSVVSGLFCIVVFVLLVVNYLQIRAADPIDDPLITELREEYAAAPERDEVLAQRIRDLDLIGRKAFFTSQGHLRAGGILLLVGVVIFLVAFKNRARWRPELPELSDTPAAETEWRADARSRQLITWTSVAVLAGGLAAAYLTETALAPTSAGVATDAAPSEEGASDAEPPVPVAKDYPTWEEVQVNWPTFRGPGAHGVAYFTNAPIEWDVQAGTGIRWKVETPRPGTNSPVVWGNRLFLTGADSENRDVYCYDTDTGDLIWQRTLQPLEGTPPQPPDVSGETGFAASTMAVHGGLVFAVFANGDLVSYDFDGELVWGYNLGLPDNHYGHSSSLLAYEGLLYVQFDGSTNARLLALDIATGEEAWTAPRETISWASPILAHTPLGPQLILNSEENVDAYEPGTGTLLWSQSCLAGEVAPSPAYGGGVVFVLNEFATATAIGMTGSPDAVQSEILWEWDELLSEVSSPVGDGERFYFGTAVGDLVCLDARTGEELWVELVDDGFYSSPVIVGDRLYILDLEGTMLIVRASAEYEQIAAIPMGERTFATPAFLDGRIYIRTEDHLYGIQ